MNDPLSIPTTSPSTPSLISQTQVPNVFPTTQVNYRLAVVGEAPGEREEQYLTPFIGPSGNLLDSILSSVGILRTGCFIGNVCKYRPPGNKITAFGFNHEKVQQGWEELKQELTTFKPHCILALGNTPLYFLTGQTGIGSWQGSILRSPYGKVVPALHPAYILREYKDWVLLRLFANRARQEADSPNFNLPEHKLELDLTANEICSRLDNWPTGLLAAFDIEGGLDAWPCSSVAGASNTGFIIAWSKYSETDQGRVARSLSRFLYREDVPKSLQNGLYDRFVCAYGYKFIIRGQTEDTMVKQAEIYPELSKGLETITQIWTRVPNYKGLMIYTKKKLKELKASGTYDPHEVETNKHKGCIIDSCVTHEATLAMDQALSDQARRHYRFNMAILEPLLYMELRGIRYDVETARTELGQVRSALSECSSRLTFRAGHSLVGAKGSISSTQLKKCLYQEKGYPAQKKRVNGVMQETTDVEALLKLSHKFTNDPFLSDILLHRKLESVKETLEITTDRDGRVRCGYNVVGTETQRLTCYTSPTGSGANLQTITKKLRKLYTADVGFDMFQCDLSGADGWTVAARCLAHGDSTMWDDYNYGLKPARIIALMYEHGGKINSMSRPELKELSKTVDDDGHIYFICKRVQHMSNYAGEEKTGAKQVMIDAYKITGVPIHITPADFAVLQRYYFLRYPGLYQWHRWAKDQVWSGANLTSASGHTRLFFGRRKSWNYKTRSYEADQDTFKEFLADEPQENTTYANNLFLFKLWNDPENRVEGKVLLDACDTFRATRTASPGGLYIEPLHTVHDANIGQYLTSRRAWSIAKIQSYGQNPIRIANVEVSIPFDGNYGPSWGQLGVKHGGGPI